MQAVLEYLFGAASFMPHGYCLLWRPDLVALHAVSDLVTAAAYFAIPAGLFVFQRHRGDLAYRWLFRLFATFILACGATHLLGFATLWQPLYGLEGLVKAATALVSAVTAAVFWPVIPKALALPGLGTLRAANARLEAEVAAQLGAERTLRQAHEELELRVRERTRELAEANVRLEAEIAERRRAEEAARGSRARLRAVVESLPFDLWVCDRNGRYVLQNSASRRHWGDRLGLRPEETDTPPELVARWVEHNARALAGETMRGEESYRIGGELRHVEKVLVPVEGDEGEVLGCVGVNVDVTERKRAAAALEESEERLRLAVQVTGLGIWDVDPCSGARRWSRQYKSILGLPPEASPDPELFASLIHPEDRNEIVARYRRAHEPGGDGRYEAEHRILRHGDGDERWVHVTGRVFFDDSGRPLRAVGTLVDVTERQRAHEALRESEERYRALVETAPDAVFVHQDGTVIFTNRPAAILLGATAPEVLIGRPVFELVDEASLPLARGRTAALSKPGARVELAELIYRRLDGTPFPVEAAAAAVLINGRLAIQVTFRDITKRREYEAALATARDRAECASQAKSEFLATMSHEIRTPLTAVIGMADLLASKALDPEAARYAGAIRGAGRQLLAIVNDILDFQRLGAGKLPLHERDFDLASALEEVGSALRPAAHDKSLALDITPLPPGTPPLRGDLVRLQQVLFNLVGNALKFTPHGRVEVRSTLAEPKEDGRIGLRIEVRDTGVGIAPDQLARLFQPFAQVNGAATRRFGGAGLGLVISRQLVELMGGRIGCESRPGEGSLFWFEVKLGRGEVRDVTAAMDTAPTRPPPLAILLAEDAPLNRQLFIDVLGRQGHRVTASEDGVEFLERAGEGPFDVLLVDIQMPGLDGAAAVRSLRGREGPNRATPAVALTANVMDEDRRRYLKAGFDAVLHKPVIWDELLLELARLVPRRAPTAEEPPGERLAGTVAAGAAAAVDWSFVEAMLGELPRAVADDFLARAPTDAREGLRSLGDAALNAQDRARLAHRLKGTARSFGLAGLGNAAEAIEHAAVRGLNLEPALRRYAAALDATAGQLADRPRLFS